VSYSQREIQIVADIRLMALSLMTIVEKHPHKSPMTDRCERIVEYCEGLIMCGPREFHHVIATVPDAAQISRELRRSAYPGRY